MALLLLSLSGDISESNWPFDRGSDHLPPILLPSHSTKNGIISPALSGAFSLSSLQSEGSLPPFSFSPLFPTRGNGWMEARLLPIPFLFFPIPSSTKAKEREHKIQETQMGRIINLSREYLNIFIHEI
ncbi:hypothetical protein PENTCL1PPCAC_1596 [Pristionchus entomophagus]|uniref:Uncharacterized protein n=1 Tax=Pristionchus entomophagus TaxID=358040 RepID=A0AAV5S8N4_9BILA|nr:hypothetical protein PENTCL1PPCAC_1596 [Pristionchus entomophagus]